MIPASHVENQEFVAEQIWAIVSTQMMLLNTQMIFDINFHLFSSKIFKKDMAYDFCFMMLTFQKPQLIHSDKSKWS